VDQDRRAHERASRKDDDPEASLREALAFRRTGELARAREALERAVALAPGHELARALLLLTEVALGQRTHGSFAEARAHAIDLVRFLDPGSLEAVARSALDPAHGPIDAEAVAALVESGKKGVLAVLEALTVEGFAGVPDRLRIAVGLRVREIARAGITPAELPARVRARILAGVAEPGETRADWALLAGGLRIGEARPALEALLGAESPAVRNAGATGLELLGDAEAAPALRRALAAAGTRGDRRLIERALDALSGAAGRS
jgi:tetratricopeptide (TPR) repeat protein